jgi:hypothetical protein
MTLRPIIASPARMVGREAPQLGQKKASASIAALHRLQVSWDSIAGGL